MKRRGFVKGLLVTPVAGAVAQQTDKPQQQPPPQPNTPARQVPQQPANIPELKTVALDAASETEPRFFAADQFAALKKLGKTLVPPLKGNPGAVEAQAPEFLDFLIGVSAPDRQKLYRDGLDHLNADAHKRYKKSFAECDDTEADAIIRPLLTVRYWPQDLPSDPLKSFMAQAHEDLRTATANSPEWAAHSTATGGRRGIFGRNAGYYWKPIDPVVRG